jgi:hypothetical protein
LNTSIKDVKALAGKYGPEAIAELARLALHAESEQARVAACKEILDRAYGKATTTVEATFKSDLPELSTAAILERLSQLRGSPLIIEGLPSDEELADEMGKPALIEHKPH